MPRLKHTFSVLLTALAVLALSITSAQAAKPDKPGGGNGGGGNGGGAELELINLHPPGYDGSYAFAINNAGIVVGQVFGGAGLEPTASFWNAAESIPSISSLAGGTGEARAINEAGEIVGWGQNGPRYWASTTDAPMDLPLPEGFHSGIALGISDDGIVTGEISQVISQQTVSSAAAWRVAGGSVFGPIVLAPNAAGYDVATLESGVNRVVGRSSDPVLGHVATAWDLSPLMDGSFSVLTSTTLVPDDTSEAWAITDSGDLTGVVKSWNDAAGTNEHIAFVIRNDSLELLASGGRNYYGTGFDLNDTIVVGETGRRWYSQGSSTSATSWDSRNKRVDLGSQYFDESWSYTLAQGINRDGDIVGYGSGGAWLLRHPLGTQATAIAIPEPSTLVLAFLCFAGAVSYTRRPRR